METKKGFIPRVVSYLNQQNLGSKQCLLVLPSRRAMLFLQDQLAQEMQAGWLPKMQVIDEFIQAQVGLQQADSSSLIFELYLAYSDLAEEVEPFEEFLKWAGQILAEFNDIDRYLVDADKLFQHVHEAKLIESWSPDQEPGAILNNFAKFYAFQGELYSKLIERLEAKSIGYQGMLLREVLNSMSSIGPRIAAELDAIFFIGFNALSPSETEIIKELRKYLPTETLWDLDGYYKNPIQEAGFFLRNNLQHFEAKPAIVDDFKEAKEFYELSCPNHYSQSKAAGAIVNKLIRKGNSLNEIALILVDESLLEPTLSSLPKEVSKINVTMGYPLRQTLLFKLIQSVLSNYRDALRKAGSGSNLSFYYKSILQILENPVLSSLNKEEEQAWFDLQEGISRAKSPYQSSKSMMRHWEGSENLSQLLGRLIPAKEMPLDSFLADLSQFVEDWVADQVKLEKPDHFGLETASQVKRVLNRLQDLNLAYPDILDIESLSYLWRQLSSSYQVNFIGEPLEGLQVMGMLESRLLNFKHVVFVGANEGELPAKRRESPFIPYDIKGAYGLPRFEEQQAIYAYNFYRLCQHAETCHFIYQTNPREGSGEPSRYLRQIRNELVEYASGKSSYTNIDYPLKRVREVSKEIEIPATAESKQRLMEIAQGKYGFSPTAIAKYFTCSLQFYWDKLAYIREQDEIREELGADLFGTLVHNVLQRIYENCPKKLSAESLQNGLDNLEITFLDELGQLEIDKQISTKGANFIKLQMAKMQLIDFLKLEIEFVKKHEVEIVALETRLESSLQVNGETIKIAGTADRIDLVDGQLRIIDYKTGKIEPKDVTVDFEGKEDIDWEKSNKALQLLIYVHLLDANLHKFDLEQAENIQAAIGLLKGEGEHYAEIRFGKQKQNSLTKVDRAEVSAEIISILAQILETTNYQQRKADNTCGYCAFSSTCKRFISNYD